MKENDKICKNCKHWLCPKRKWGECMLLIYGSEEKSVYHNLYNHWNPFLMTKAAFSCKAFENKCKETDENE